jgi:hypothetical protein
MTLRGHSTGISRPTPLAAEAAVGLALTRVVRWKTLAALVVVLVGLGLCGQAWADILLGENVFYPYNPPVSSRLQAKLNQETAAAHRTRFPLKVALIATPVDLGAIPSFFGKPQQYAAFLDQEISFGAKVPLLVVMPNGYGAAGMSGLARAIVGSLRPPDGRSGNALAQAAATGVGKLSAAAGHPVADGSSGGGTAAGGGGVALPLVVLAAVCILAAGTIITVRVRRPRATARRP